MENPENRFLPLNDEGELEIDHELNDSPLFLQTLDEIMLLSEAGNQFSEDKIANGTLSPVFFGSALTTFGVQTFLDAYLQICS